jgi:hypothetical protein
MKNNTQSVDSKILSRIYGSGSGAVSTPSHFLDLGSRRAVDLTLYRLVRRKILRRLARGLYEYPRQHPELGTLSPDIRKVARALAGKDRIRLQPAGAYGQRGQTILLHVLVLATGVFLRQDCVWCHVKYASNILGRYIMSLTGEIVEKPSLLMMEIVMISSRPWPRLARKPVSRFTPFV